MSETVKRIISGFAIAAIYGTFFNLETLDFLPLYFFICLVTVIVLKEFYSMFLKDSLDAFNRNIGIIFGILMVSYYYVRALIIYRSHHTLDLKIVNDILDLIPNDPVIIYSVLILMFIILGVYNILTSRLKGAIYSMSISFLGVIYISLTIPFILLLRALPDGIFFIWLVSFITVMTDTAGYAFGRLFGRHKLSIPVSPNKTWEGYIGAFFTQLVLTVLFYEGVSMFFTVPEYSILKITGISIMIYITAIFGDLFESFIKRNGDSKDSGHLLPGHGGLLDRVDSIMFSLPVFYFYLLLTR